MRLLFKKKHKGLIVQQQALISIIWDCLYQMKRMNYSTLRILSMVYKNTKMKVLEFSNLLFFCSRILKSMIPHLRLLVHTLHLIILILQFLRFKTKDSGIMILKANLLNQIINKKGLCHLKVAFQILKCQIYLPNIRTKI